MAIPTPQQPILHPEAPPPLLKQELKGAQPQIKPPDLVEITRLQADFVTTQTSLDKARATLKTAQAVKAGHAIKLNSPEYQLIAKRQQAGESIDDIIGKSAANVRGLHETALGRELPFREAEASLLRSEVGSPATEQDILRIVNGLEKHHALRLDDPALAEVNRRKQAGESLAEIKAQAQQVIDRRERASKTLRIAEAMKHPQNAQPLDLDIEATIKNRMWAGENLDDIIRKTRANLDGYAEVDSKKDQLGQTLRRVEEIKSEKQVIAGTKQREQELAASQQLEKVRQQIESMQHGGKEVSLKTVQELLQKGQAGFLSELSDLQLKVMMRDAEQLRKEGRLKPFQPLEAQVQTPEMCGYSAPAITESFRRILGNDASAKTVYGHYARDSQRPYHYWTEIVVQGQKFVACATYGQFDEQYRGRILFDRAENMGKYGLQEYQANGRGTEVDENTVRTLQANNNNLPIETNLDPKLKEGYEKLKVTLTVTSRGKAQ